MAEIGRKIDAEAQSGMKISKLVKWNPYLESVKIEDKPLIPFANQLAFLRSTELEVLYGGATRGGKAASYSSKVITPFGERLMGDLQVGDLVSIPNGGASKILMIHEQGEKDIYKIHFSDGRIAECTDEHLWKVKKTRTNRRKSNKNGEGGWYISNTREMIEYISKKGKYNLAIPLTEPVIFTKSYKVNMRKINPYLLGVLIGDGCITDTSSMISVAGIDGEVFDEIEKLGYSLTRHKKQATILQGSELKSELNKLKLLGTYSYNKFIPEYYKYATVDDRIALIQGLMDTDGYVDDRGHLSYTTTSEQLAKDVQWVIRSLGGRASITDKIPTYTHEEIKKEGRRAYTVWIQIKDKDRLVRLSRKKERCKDCDYIGGFQDPSLTIEKIELDRREKARCITISHVDGLYLAGDFVVTHNSIAMLMAASQYVDCPTYNAIIFRKTYQELSKGDGLIPTSMRWFKPFEKEGVRWNDDNMQWEFPSGSILGFGYLASERDKYKYIGQAYQFIGFDELTQQPEDNYTFLFSRLVRDKYQESLNIPLRVRSTTNPNGDHVQWVYDRFVNKRTRKNIQAQVMETGAKRLKCKPAEVPEDFIKYLMPKFIPSLARDNPYLDMDSYINSLDKLDPVTRAQLAEGNWEIRAMGNMFNRDWFEKIPYAKVPVNDLQKIRYWDLAATRDGDFTASCHLGFDKNQGVFYILDMKLFRMTPREIEREIQLAAELDGPRTMIYMEREPGSAGMHNIDHYKRKVIPPGHTFREDRVSGDKESRARPVSAAAEKELIKIAWTRKSDDWFNPVMEQLETFPEGEHDDAVDALASAFNALSKRLYSRGQYIGKVDWMMPTEATTSDKLSYGPKDEMTIEDLIRGKKISF
jgi:predicted phage terminase large subunit-like protein